MKKITKSVDRDKWVADKVGFLYLRLSHDLDRGRHPFLPTQAFYTNHAKTEQDLSELGKEILRHLGVTTCSPAYSFASNLGATPGLYVHDQGRQIIYINTKYRSNPYACAAILAHELMHYYLLSLKGISVAERDENELLTDLATIYLGLGVLVVNGMHNYNNWFLTVIALFGGFFIMRTESLSFGYFKPYQYVKYFKEYLQKNSISVGLIGHYIHPKTWFFFRGIPFKDKLSRDSIFFKQALRKISLNLLGVVIVVVLCFTILPRLTNYSTSTQYDETAIKMSEQLDGDKKQLSILKTELEMRKLKLEQFQVTDSNAEEYSSMVDEYNALVDKYKKFIQIYNNNVNIYNQRIGQ